MCSMRERWYPIWVTFMSRPCPATIACRWDLQIIDKQCMGASRGINKGRGPQGPLPGKRRKSGARMFICSTTNG